jgi:hypothetical protein
VTRWNWKWDEPPERKSSQPQSTPETVPQSTPAVVFRRRRAAAAASALLALALLAAIVGSHGGGHAPAHPKRATSSHRQTPAQHPGREKLTEEQAIDHVLSYTPFVDPAPTPNSS